jgi:AraC-like DNA-binding protein
MPRVELVYKLDLAPESVWLTVTASATAKSSIIYVQELGDFIAHKDYYTKRNNLPSFLIKYTLSGEGMLHYNGQTMSISPGDIFWIDCMNKQHYYTSPSVGNWRVIWVHFYGETSQTFYELFLMQNNGNNKVTLPPDNNVAAALYSLISLYHSGESSLTADIQAAGLLTNIMAECVNATNSHLTYSGIPENIHDAKMYLLNHYNERITLDDLALRYSINKYHFQKLFKRYAGFTPNEYLILTRLNHAKENLRATSKSISEIAHDVGVDNVSHFINLFKKHEGITPNVYRKNWRR